MTSNTKLPSWLLCWTPSLFGLASHVSRTQLLTFTVVAGGIVNDQSLNVFFSLPLLARGPLPPELFDYVAEMSRPEGELESLTPASGWRGTLRSDDEDLPGNNPIWWQSWAMRLRFFASVGNKYYHHWLSTRATNNTARHFSVFFDFHSLEMFYNIRKIGNSSK